MKNSLPKALLLCFIFLSITFRTDAQSRCGTQLLHQQKMHNDPAYKARYEAVERSINQALKNQSKARANCVNPTFFPIAIHFDWTPSAADQAKLITLAQNQVVTLNTAYNGSDCQGTTNSNCFEFKLATNNHPAGSGLTEGQPAVTFGGTAGIDYCATNGGRTEPCNLSRWTGYMNITVNNLSGGNECSDLGVSHLVGNPTSMNSMSVNSCAFGSIGIVTGVAEVQDNSTANKCDCLENAINGGATVVHEIGHFLGLKHTFCVDNPTNGFNVGSVSAAADIARCEEASVCSGGCTTTACDCDDVTDTPPQAFSNNGCPGGSAAGTVANASNSNILHAFSNYMDYVDDACMNCFSQGQYSRLASTIASTGAGVAAYKTKAQVCPTATTVTAQADPIPTMGEWALIIFGLLILNLSIFYMIKKDSILN